MEKSKVRRGLFRLEYARKRLLQPYFAALGLTAGQGQPRILERLYAGDGLSQRELAQACSLDATTLSRALDRLEEAGLIVRESHPDSRRAYLVRLTGPGRETAAAVAAGFSRVDGLLWQGFTAGEMDCLAEALERMTENLEHSDAL